MLLIGLRSAELVQLSPGVLGSPARTLQSIGSLLLHQLSTLLKRPLADLLALLAAHGGGVFNQSVSAIAGNTEDSHV